MQAITRILSQKEYLIKTSSHSSNETNLAMNSQYLRILIKGLITITLLHLSYLADANEPQYLYANPLSQEPGRHYDEQGRYQGHLEQQGKSYDQQGRYDGRIDKNGQLYDSYGHYEGKITSDNKWYDANGKYLGRRDKNNQIFNAQGQYQGRIVDGRLYDKSGRYQGRIDLR